ncbi:nuclear autoantigenic sperm protein isoform X2 [Takifugu rubripes]|uniref:nuclear autoantigenic sperm protein isoform X2 n=1 Tax=Takifugu rubripes TaxID=31033 RepID=UPI0011452A80|nr:nuclear autoantigenic sperm protein-like isoform X2 [Takifugu rubripes]
MPEGTYTASSSGSAEEQPCSSSAAAAAEDSSVDVMEEAKKLVGAGNKYLVLGDVVSAVAVFQDACSMLAAKYGDTADECGEALFLCGKSLLELARMENSVLGNALEGVPEESEGEEQPTDSKIESADNLDEKTRDELRMQVYDAMAEKPKEVGEESVAGSVKTDEKRENSDAQSPVKSVNSANHEAKGNGVEKSPVPPVNDIINKPATNEEEPDKDVNSNAEAEEEDEGAEDDDDSDEDDEAGEGNGQAKEEEVGNLQLAWEMLEVAKVIYKRKDDEDGQLTAAQIYLKLGEVSAESGNYPQALEDFQECLCLQLKHLPPHSRLLAETHYHVATTLCYMDKYSQAIQHYNSSIEVIEKRLGMLQEAIAKAEGEDGTAEEERELEELKQLLPEIREKVEDAAESQRTASAASQAIQQALGGASTSSAFRCENGGPSSSSLEPASQVPVTSSDSPPSKMASDISHLVRKKRKPEEGRVKDTDAKQAKQETTVNGSSDSTASNSNAVQGKSQESANQTSPVKSSS